MLKIKSFFLWWWHHKIRSILIIGVLAIVVMVIVNMNKPPQMEKAQVRLGAVANVVEASGKIQAKKYAELAFAVPGKVVWVGVKKGDWVQPYQVIATQDQQEVEKNIKNKLLDYMTTRWDFEQGHDDKNVNGRNLKDVTGLSTAEMRILEKSQFGLDQAVLEVEIAALAREQYQLVTPIAGAVIDDGNLLAGERLNATTVGTKQVRIVDSGSLYFQANVDEIDYSKVRVGQTVTIKLDSFPDREFIGKVDYIGREGVKKTGGSVQIPVDISLASGADLLIPELNGDAQIILEKKSDVIVVEKKFIQKNGNKYSANVLVNNKLIEKPVKIGLVGLSTYEIVEGLHVGDTVANIIK